MVEIMKCERYEAPPPPQNSSANHQHHHMHMHHFSSPPSAMVMMGQSGNRPMPPPPMPPPTTLRPNNAGNAPLMATATTAMDGSMGGVNAMPVQRMQNGGVATAANGVTVLNGSQTPIYKPDNDPEKGWWVCCLEFCFCLL